MISLVGIYILLLLPSGSVQLFPGVEPDEGDYRHLYPTVCVSVGIVKGYARNALSYTLGFLETMRYPKDRMHVSFLVDDSDESNREHLEKWTDSVSQHIFRSASLKVVDRNWREEALIFSRQRSCNYALIMDSDCFILPDTLKRLIDLNLVVVSPLLNAPFGRHSNVDGLLEDDFVFRKEEYVGNKRVYYANNPLLINLKHLDGTYLTFDDGNVRNYNGDGRPVNVLGFSAFSMSIPIFVNSEFFYGYFIDSGIYSQQEHREVFNTFLANQISDHGPMPFLHSSIVQPFHNVAARTTFGFDKVFLVNLARRPERLRKMDEELKALGVAYEVHDAVDGQTLTDSELSTVRFLSGYRDPFHQRPMKRGEIGCFLSHYGIWRRLVDEELDRVIVLEDDVRFTENGTRVLRETVEDLMKTRLDWDFMYLGRKRMNPQGKEFFVPGHRHLSTVTYSYWTLGYAITRGGAQKLLDAKPLQKMLALDEFLPIMYGQHPNAEWAQQFHLPADGDAPLKSYATYPVVVEPERYTNQPGYVSDTEASSVVDPGGLVNVSTADDESLTEMLAEDLNIHNLHAVEFKNDKDEL